MRNNILLKTMVGVLLFCALLLSSIFSPPTFAAMRTMHHDDNPCPITVSKGSSGAEVSELQWELDWAFGYNLTVNGQFGPDTDTAVKDFQNRYTSPTDGIVDATTWHTLGRC